MATDEMILDSDRFVMLDLVNTISENETDQRLSHCSDC